MGGRSRDRELGGGREGQREKKTDKISSQALWVLPHAWQEPKYLSHELLPPRVHVCRNLDCTWKWDSHLETPLREVSDQSSILTQCS